MAISSIRPLPGEAERQVYERILVAMDCSSVDDAIIEHVAKLAVQNSAQLYLLHVVHSHPLPLARAPRAGAETLLESRREVLEGQGIAVHVVIRSGEPEAEILDEIEGNGYDLVAMATHGHSFLGDLLFGSVSRVLKHRISVPLLLIGPRK